MPGVQLIALQELSKDAQENFRTLTGLIKASNSASELIPYIKIYNPDTGKLLYTNNKFFSSPNFNFNDLIIDLIEAEIEVGKSGVPSLIEGTLNFKILNQNKMVNPDRTLKTPELFALLSNINVSFGWASLYKKFDESCIIRNFNTNYAGNNVMDLTISFGSPLTYLNEVNSALWENLKDTSKLKSESDDSTINNNATTDLLNNTQINSTLSKLSDNDNPYKFLISVYDNFKFPNKDEMSVNLTTQALNSFHNIDIYELLWKENYHYFSIGFINESKNTSLTFYSGEYNYIDIWYANETNLSTSDRTNNNNNTYQSIQYNAIIPKIFNINNYDKYIRSQLPNELTDTDKKTLYAIENIENNTLSINNDNYTTYISAINDASIDKIYYDTLYFNPNTSIITGNYDQYIVNITQITYETGMNGTTPGLYFNIYLTCKDGTTITYKNNDKFTITSDIITKLIHGYSDEQEEVNTIVNNIINDSKTISTKTYNTNIHTIYTYDKNNTSIERDFIISLIKDHISFIFDLKQIIDKYITLINNKTNFLTDLVKIDIIQSYKKYSNNVIKNISELGIKASNIKISRTISRTFSLDPQNVYIVDIKQTNNTTLSYIDYAMLAELNNINQVPNNNINNNKLWKKYINSSNITYKKIINKSIIDNFNSIYQCLNLLVNIIEFNNKKNISNINYNTVYNYNWHDIYTVITSKSSTQDKLIADQNAFIEHNKELSQQNDQNNTEKSTFINYQTSTNKITLQSIADDLNIKFAKSQEDNFLVKIDFYASASADVPSLSTNKHYIIKWNENDNSMEDTSNENKNTINLLKKSTLNKNTKNSTPYKIENLRIPTHIYNNILQHSTSLFDLLNRIFKYFNEFNINLMYSVYRETDTKTTIIEIFNIDMISEAVQKWNGDLSFSSVANELKDAFIVFDYNSLNSIILDLTVNAKTQDSLFTTFMPILNKDNLVGIFTYIIKNPSAVTNKVISNIETVYRTVFKDNGTNIQNFNGQVKKLQQYANNNNLSKIINDKFGKDDKLTTALIELYMINGSYPAHLLFAGYSISLKILGFNNLASFQVFGLRNSGLSDGLYMIESVKHSIDKTKFETTIEARLLNPRIGSYKDLIGNK